MKRWILLALLLPALAACTTSSFRPVGNDEYRDWLGNRPRPSP